MSSRIAVHYGHHEGTTGVHFAEAAQRLNLGVPYAALPRRHMSVLELQTMAYLWIESGVVSMPLDTHRSPVPTAGYLIDVHMHLELSRLEAELFDVVFVAQRNAVSALQETHPNVHWLPLAAPASFLQVPRTSTYDASFVGNLWRSTTRERMMEQVGQRVATNDFRRFHSVTELARVYAGSRMVVNPAISGDLNMRFFEAIACGAAVLTPDVGNGQDDVAERGRDFFVCDFRDPDLVADEVERLLNLGVSGEQGRDRIADGHTYDHRVSHIAEVLSESPLAAPVRNYSQKRLARLWADLAFTLEDLPLVRVATGLATPGHVPWSAVARAARAGTWKSTKESLKRRAPRLVSGARRIRPARARTIFVPRRKP